MNRRARPWMVVLALVPLLVGCSPDCVWIGEGHAFLDANKDGYWNAGEPPLEGVTISVHDVLDGARGEGGASDGCGRVQLYVWMSGCPKVELEAYAEPPLGYRLTTPARVPVHDGFEGIELVRFGFAPLEEPNP